MEEEYVRSVMDSDTDAVFAIIAKDKNLHIGTISLQNIDWESGVGEFAILLGNKSYWRKGIGGEASRLVLRFAFETLKLKCVRCGTFAENEGMKHLAKSLGFAEEGLRAEPALKAGVPHKVVEYSLRAEDFTI
jgi:RimJ/RimL family protein N-acetyltransferase